MLLRLMLLMLACLSRSLWAQQNAAEQSAVSVDNERCSQIFNRTVTAFQELHRKLPPEAVVPNQSPLLPLLNMRADDCLQAGAMARIEKALSQHSGKIALLLPLSRLPKIAGQELLRSVHEWLASKGVSPGRLIIWRDTEGNRDKLERQLAQSIWLYGASVIIGGLYQSEAPLLAQWSDRLRVPSIILNRRPENATSRHTFFVGPDHRLLASGLTRYALGRNMKHLAILAPQFSRDETLISAFRTQAQHLQIQVSGPLIYNPADYSSIDGLVRKLFHIDDESRNQELLDLVNKGKEEAAALGVPFDAKGVVLPPVIDVDAILIADHFKNVRHLSKILAFYGVKRLPLLGVPRWRAYELVDPPDDNLVGSVFVDYLGSYRQLPYGIQVPTVDKEQFAEGHLAATVDLRLVVHHALFAAIQALAGPKQPRYALHKKLEASSGPRDSFLSGARIFQTDHSSNWPSFLYSVGSGSISLLQIWNPVAGPSRTSSVRK